VDDGFRFVIIPLDEGFSGLVINTFPLRRVEDDMVGFSRALADSPSGKPLDDRLIRQDEIDDCLDIAHGFKRVSLRDSSRKTVKDIACFGVLFHKSVLHHSDGDVIRHQPATGEDGFHLLAQFRLILDVRPEQVAGRNMRNMKIIFCQISNCALSCSRRAKKNKIHFSAPFPNHTKIVFALKEQLRYYFAGGAYHMNKIVLHATDLDGYLNEDDKKKIAKANKMYEQSLGYCQILDNASDVIKRETACKELVENAGEIGDYLKEVTSEIKRIHVYSFETPQEQHGAASRLIAKLRSPETQHEEFLYYIQRAYELLFSHVYADAALPNKRSIITKTPVTNPCRNFAVHRIPDVDNLIHNSVMCVMLRGALLPSMILSKEIQDYSSDNFVTPFALFKIKRDETKHESNMDYVLDLDRSFFNAQDLDGKDLIFADPMNATGGSLVTIINYLKGQGIKPKSIKFINVIAALKGSLRICRALPEAEVYTLWMDPVLNDQAYILPGLGDAGDRLNGLDLGDKPRNMIQLIADYGTNIVNLYRSQVKIIEDTVLGK